MQHNSELWREPAQVNRIKTLVWGVVLTGIYIFLFNECVKTVSNIVKKRESTLAASIYPDLIEGDKGTVISGAGMKENPGVVITGTYLERILSFELQRSRWDYEFYQWFKWDTRSVPFAVLDSLHKGPVIPENLPFKIVNSNILSAEMMEFKLNPQTHMAYALYFVRASSTQFFIPDAFPLDKHFLYIPIEHTTLDHTKLSFIPDLVSSKVSSRVNVNGYVKGERMASSSLHTYQSAYGDPDFKSSSTKTYNQYRFGIIIKRDGYYYYIKLFTVLLVSVLIAFLSFYAQNTDKLRITVGALFTTAANNYVLTKNIPETSATSIAEIVDIVSLVTIFIIMCDQTLLKYVMRENKKLTDSVQWTTFGITLFFYILINIVIPIIGK